MRLALRNILFPLALVVIGLSPLHAQSQALRVCADPDYLPFSNRAGEGFENAIAEAVGRALGRPVEYSWDSYRERGFLQFLGRTLEANECDVVMSIPYGSREALSTQPYYVSSYVFVFKRDRNYSIQSMSSAALARLTIGFERETPVEDGLKRRGLVGAGSTSVGFDVGEDSTVSPEIMLDALENDRIDVLITWQPAIGGFLDRHPDLTVVTVPNQRTLGSPEQYSFPMSMGVRADDQALQRILNDVIARTQDELTTILRLHGVGLFASPE
jgi:mxaJ protein